MTWSNMEAKFRGLVEPVLGEETKPLYDILRRFEEPGQLKRIMAKLDARVAA